MLKSPVKNVSRLLQNIILRCFFFLLLWRILSGLELKLFNQIEDVWADAAEHTYRFPSKLWRVIAPVDSQECVMSAPKYWDAFSSFFFLESYQDWILFVVCLIWGFPSKLWQVIALVVSQECVTSTPKYWDSFSSFFLL